MVWYSHFFKNFPKFVVIHTVKVDQSLTGFSIVNESVVKESLLMVDLIVVCG